LHFQQGEILKGSVQGIRPDGTISLLINDKLVTAVSEEPLIPGQQLNLLVNSFRNGSASANNLLSAHTPNPPTTVETGTITPNVSVFRYRHVSY